MASLKIDRGTTYIRTGTVRIDGVIIDLTAATIRFTMKSDEFDSDYTDTDALVKKNVTGTSLGAYTIELTPDDTAEIEPGTYFYDIKVELATGKIYKIDEGKVILDGSPTNRLS